MDEELKQQIEAKDKEIETLNNKVAELEQQLKEKEAENESLKQTNERFNETLIAAKAEADSKLQQREQELKNEITERDNVIKQLFEGGESKPQESSVDRVLKMVNANRNYNY